LKHLADFCHRADGGGRPKEGGGKLHIKKDGREYRAAVFGAVGWTKAAPEADCEVLGFFALTF